MDFHIPFSPTPIEQKLNLTDRLIAVGSCFSEHMANSLIANKLACFSHPFGTLYHPNAIAKSLVSVENYVVEDDSVTHQGLHFHWDAHSKLWGNTTEELADNYISAVTALKKELSKANWIIITLGSAYEYSLKSTGRAVANCHKQPQAHFDKMLTSVDEMRQNQLSMISALKELNPSLQFLYTVSPVRHVRDGLQENHISKGRLLELAHSLSEDPDIHYFPSYEIIMDQLRDYRFFNQDGIHPNKQAIDYIWEVLSEAWFSENLVRFIKKWSPIRQALEHKPLYPNSDSHEQFCESMIQKLHFISEEIDVSEEIEFFKSHIN